MKVDAKRRRRRLGVVMAGGQSSRMGIDKAALKTTGQRTFLTHAVERLRPLVQRVIVAGDPRPNFQHDFVADQDDVAGHGPLGGVTTALRFAAANGFDTVLVTPVDAPVLCTDHLAPLCIASDRPDLADSEQPVVAISEQPVVAISDRPQPLIAIYSVDVLGEFEQAVGAGESLMRWLRKRTYQGVEISSDATANINTRSEYQAYYQSNGGSSLKRRLR